MGGDTQGGVPFKNVVEAALRGKQGIEVVRGFKISGSDNLRNRFDFRVAPRGQARTYGIVSCRSQTVGGTAEEKVPFEVIRILRLMKSDPNCVKGWVILGGTGWGDGMIEFLRGDLKDYLVGGKAVNVITTDELLTLAKLF